MTQVNGDTVLQSEVLEDLSDAVNYQRWLADLVRPHLGDEPLEIGSGLGYYAALWLPDVRHFTATEADPARLVDLKERYAGEPRVTVRQLALPAPAEGIGQHSCIVALNVWEHIDDHVGALRSAAAMLRPGGRVVLVVPAFESAMSNFDRLIGHVRRYTTKSMRELLEAAGLEIQDVHYINPVGLLSWYVVCKLLRQRPKNGLLLRVYDRVMIPMLRRAEQGRRPPFGQSVFAVAIKR
ncbi:class I SAM-dependent methyltransferase [Allorhizocola rhizosphaerae]|uniref:class I SAM-dependent methyltransferase n=1 Tax=Allorhizocola rhizosphaerae TaxID=1872709 RepID=UPI000E3E6719|nr:class I SAM-dependent methyltransferase [Allorhizocola rhizosphaerae]